MDSNNFNYKSGAEKKLAVFEKSLLSEKAFYPLEKDLLAIKNKLLKIKNRILYENKSEIVNKIREELATRINGRKGRITEELRHDNQYVTAINILEHIDIYEKLLNLKPEK